MTENHTPDTEEWSVPDEPSMRRLGAEIVRRFQAGDVIFLEGELGAGKTTLVRGMLEGLGWGQEVRSPTFNLMHEYPTLPPVLHADLYRVASWQGIGLEDYLESHLCVIEWPDRARGLVATAHRIAIDFAGEGRLVTLKPSG
jgi:tRNA threonylcarbamoyladenosine biosynthesis protein TsaE